MPQSRRNFLLWLAVGLVVVAGLAFGVWRWRSLSSTNSTANTNARRQTYAALYQAAWRQDDGHNPTLVTATLLVPPTVQALGADTGRSSAEEQEWQTMKSLSTQQVPFIVTLDTVGPAIPDDTIIHGLSLRLDNGKSFALDSWNPIIAPSRVSNTNGSPTSQIGVAIFKVGTNLDWTTVNIVQLTLNGIPNEPYRVFTWTEPKLLLEVK